jgi:hypothetical protein
MAVFAFALAGLLAVPASAQISRAVVADLSKPKVSLAAREIGRFLRHFDAGRALPELLSTDQASQADDTVRMAIDSDLDGESYSIQRGASSGELLIRGGTDQALLFASYRLAELLGVRFSLAGEAMPAPATAAWLNRELLAQGLANVLPLHDSPVFATRGLQPFHVSTRLSRPKRLSRWRTMLNPPRLISSPFHSLLSPTMLTY